MKFKQKNLSLKESLINITEARAKPQTLRAGPLSRVGAAVAVCALLGAVGCENEGVSLESLGVSPSPGAPVASNGRNGRKKAEGLVLSYMKDPEKYLSLPMDDFKYHHHKCTKVVDDYLCVACYTHPKSYLGVLNMKCPEVCLEGNDCNHVCKPLITADDLKENNIDLSYCERSFHSRK